MSGSTQIISSANDLLAAHATLLSQVRESQRSFRDRLQSIQSPPLDLIELPLVPTPSPPISPITSRDSPPASPTEPRAHRIRQDIPPAKRARAARYRNYVPEEETIRNDYSQRYVDSGEWPQNWVLGAEPEHRFEEYPKQQRLLNLKKASVKEYSLPPTYLPFSELNTISPCKFDVILLDPPFSSSFTWDDLQNLPVPSLAADPSFVFLWVGSGAGEGLERGRDVLAKWGYRRCEDVVWVKTNKSNNRGPGTDPPTTSLLTRTKQHCLIGIRGTVRRSTDSWFVHCNVDTDVIFWEGDPTDPMRKPPEMYTLIENFCLGTRRLEIFGRANSSLRRGWVTMLNQIEEEDLLREKGPDPTIYVEGEDGTGGEVSRWDREKWDAGIKELAGGGKAVVPMSSDIDALRPKSPFRPGSTTAGAGGGGGGSSGGVPVGMGTQAPRFNNGNRGVNLPSNVMMGVGQPGAFGMMNQMGMGNMGMNGMNGMDGMGGMVPGMAGMGGWGGGMNMGGMNGMAVPGMNMHMGGMGMGNMSMPGMMQGGGFQQQMPMFQHGSPAAAMMQMGVGGSGQWDQGGQNQAQYDWDGEMVNMGSNGHGLGQWGR
ncbi:regulatory protein [Marasmius tenuissimus]|nr:regulatory protein [Marasmius tenuissimus]